MLCHVASPQAFPGPEGADPGPEGADPGPEGADPDPDPEGAGFGPEESTRKNVASMPADQEQHVYKAIEKYGRVGASSSHEQVPIHPSRPPSSKHPAQRPKADQSSTV